MRARLAGEKHDTFCTGGSKWAIGISAVLFGASGTWGGFRLASYLLNLESIGLEGRAAGAILSSLTGTGFFALGVGGAACLL